MALSNLSELMLLLIFFFREKEFCRQGMSMALRSWNCFGSLISLLRLRGLPPYLSLKCSISLKSPVMIQGTLFDSKNWKDDLKNNIFQFLEPGHKCWRSNIFLLRGL